MHYLVGTLRGGKVWIINNTSTEKESIHQTTEMNPNEKSKHVKLHLYFQKTISESPPGAVAHKPGSSERFSTYDEQEVSETGLA